MTSPRINWRDPRSLAPSAPITLTDEQWRFLKLHARHDPPIKWQWHFGSAMLRAYTERGHTATISAPGFYALVEADLVVCSGVAAAVITDKGRDAC